MGEAGIKGNKRFKQSPPGGEAKILFYLLN